MYDYGARFYDPIIGRFTTIDPLTEKCGVVSPYNYVTNNPISVTDPTGREPEWRTGMEAFSPIYNTSGQLIGTDDEGLKGRAIVMNESDFTQGMSHQDALDNNLGVRGLINDHAKVDLLNSYAGLKDRPDYDGKLTLSEANDWYKNGGGKPLFVDLKKID